MAPRIQIRKLEDMPNPRPLEPHWQRPLGVRKRNGLRREPDPQNPNRPVGRPRKRPISSSGSEGSAEGDGEDDQEDINQGNTEDGYLGDDLQDDMEQSRGGESSREHQNYEREPVGAVEGTDGYADEDNFGLVFGTSVQRPF